MVYNNHSIWIIIKFVTYYYFYLINNSIIIIHYFNIYNNVFIKYILFIILIIFFLNIGKKAFGTIEPDTFNIIGYDSNILSNVVTYAHLHNVKVLLSVGGWSGSEFFTEMTSSEENRNAFIENVRLTLLNFNLDGIDIDWEYPGRVGYNNK